MSDAVRRFFDLNETVQTGTPANDEFGGLSQLGVPLGKLKHDYLGIMEIPKVGFWQWMKSMKLDDGTHTEADKYRLRMIMFAPEDAEKVGNILGDLSEDELERDALDDILDAADISVNRESVGGMDVIELGSIGDADALDEILSTTSEMPDCHEGDATHVLHGIMHPNGQAISNSTLRTCYDELKKSGKNHTVLFAPGNEGYHLDPLNVVHPKLQERIERIPLAMAIRETFMDGSDHQSVQRIEKDGAIQNVHCVKLNSHHIKQFVEMQDRIAAKQAMTAKQEQKKTVASGFLKPSVQLASAEKGASGSSGLPTEASIDPMANTTEHLCQLSKSVHDNVMRAGQDGPEAMGAGLLDKYAEGLGSVSGFVTGKGRKILSKVPVAGGLVRKQDIAVATNVLKSLDESDTWTDELAERAIEGIIEQGNISEDVLDQITRNVPELSLKDIMSGYNSGKYSVKDLRMMEEKYNISSGNLSLLGDALKIAQRLRTQARSGMGAQIPIEAYRTVQVPQHYVNTFPNQSAYTVQYGANNVPGHQNGMVVSKDSGVIVEPLERHVGEGVAKSLVNGLKTLVSKLKPVSRGNDNIHMVSYVIEPKNAPISQTYLPQGESIEHHGGMMEAGHTFVTGAESQFIVNGRKVTYPSGTILRAAAQVHDTEDPSHKSVKMIVSRVPSQYSQFSNWENGRQMQGSHNTEALDVYEMDNLNTPSGRAYRVTSAYPLSNTEAKEGVSKPYAFNTVTMFPLNN